MAYYNFLCCPRVTYIWKLTKSLHFQLNWPFIKIENSKNLKNHQENPSSYYKNFMNSFYDSHDIKLQFPVTKITIEISHYENNISFSTKWDKYSANGKTGFRINFHTTHFKCYFNWFSRMLTPKIINELPYVYIYIYIKLLSDQYYYH